MGDRLILLIRKYSRYPMSDLHGLNTATSKRSHRHSSFILGEILYGKFKERIKYNF